MAEVALKDSTLDRYAQSDLLERYAEVDDSPIYFHSRRCPSFCDYACNGRRGQDIAELIAAREANREAEARRLLERSYALSPCAECQPHSQEAYRSDSRCPACGTSPAARIAKQRRITTAANLEAVAGGFDAVR